MQPISASNNGNLNVSLAGNVSAFGEARVTEPTANAQFSFVYGINSNYVTITTATSGTVTASNQFANLTTTNTSGSSAMVTSRHPIYYRPGEGGIGRFATIFGTAIANNNQLAGLANDSVDGLFFGYHGTSFGILHRRNSVDTWFTQSNWNVDNMSGTGGASNKSGTLLNTSVGNIYQILLGYPGFGNISFWIYSLAYNNFVKVHSLVNPNPTNTIVTNPNMNMMWQTINTSSTTGTSPTLSAASAGLFTDGNLILTGAKYSRSNTSTALSTTPINFLTLYNNSTINSINNSSSIVLQFVSFFCTDTSAAQNNGVTINIYLNATTSGGTITAIDATNSIASINTGVTSTSGGTLLYSFCQCFASSQIIDLSSFNISISPVDTLSFVMNTISTASSNVAGVSISWIENT